MVNLINSSYFPTENISNNQGITKLPDEVLLKIFQKLDTQDLFRLAKVSQKFYEVSSHDDLWRSVIERECPQTEKLLSNIDLQFAIILSVTGKNLKPSKSMDYKLKAINELKLQAIERAAKVFENKAFINTFINIRG